MLSPRGEVIVRYLGVVVAFTVAHNLFSAIFFRGAEDVRRTSDIQSRRSEAKEAGNLDEDVVHEWLSSNGLSQYYAVYSENHITTLFQG